MRKLISAASTAALLAMTSWVATTPAIAGAARDNLDKQNQYISSFCAKYRGADQCNEWRAGHASWTSEQYRSFYRRHQDDGEFANPEAANLFGLGHSAGGRGPAQDGGGNE